MLRLEAPLMSFGGVAIDQINPTDRFPGRAMLAGLLANALGWDHRDVRLISGLQAAMRHAARWDAEPTHFVDYQTVNLGLSPMEATGWTTRGRREDRGGGSATSGTHQRWRHYWANGCVTVAISVQEPSPVSMDELEQAFRQPARPLFIGRKPCIPSSPMLLGRRQADCLSKALIEQELPDVSPRRRPDRVEACWPADEEPVAAHTSEVYDLRDWQSNLHTGSQRYAFGFLEVDQ